MPNNKEVPKGVRVSGKKASSSENQIVTMYIHKQRPLSSLRYDNGCQDTRASASTCFIQEILEGHTS